MENDFSAHTVDASAAAAAAATADTQTDGTGEGAAATPLYPCFPRISTNLNLVITQPLAELIAYTTTEKNASKTPQATAKKPEEALRCAAKGATNEGEDKANRIVLPHYVTYRVGNEDTCR